MSEKIKLQKYLKIRKSTKNVRNPYILRTLLPILYLFENLKLFWDFIWVGYCLNEFITFKGYSNDAQKNKTKKLLKN